MSSVPGLKHHPQLSCCAWSTTMEQCVYPCYRDFCLCSVSLCCVTVHPHCFIHHQKHSNILWMSQSEASSEDNAAHFQGQQMLQPYVSTLPSPYIFNQALCLHPPHQTHPGLIQLSRDIHAYLFWAGSDPCPVVSLGHFSCNMSLPAM